MLNPQAQKIYQILLDGQWHCPSEWNFADGHCKRITDINNYFKPQGLQVISTICDCGHHTSKVKKRRIAAMCFVKDGLMVCYCGKCKQENYPLPEDFIHPLERPLYDTYKKAILPSTQAFLDKWAKPKEKTINALF